LHSPKEKAEQAAQIAQYSKEDAMEVEDEPKEVSPTKTDPRRLVDERYQCLNRAVQDVEQLQKLPILSDPHGELLLAPPI
jgi:hypothetical protein